MGKHIKYTNEIRFKAVQMYLDGISAHHIIAELGIRDVRRVRVWVNRYLEGNAQFVDKRGQSNNVTFDSKNPSEMTKDEYIAFLEMEVDILKLMTEM